MEAEQRAVIAMKEAREAVDLLKKLRPTAGVHSGYAFAAELERTLEEWVDYQGEAMLVNWLES